MKFKIKIQEEIQSNLSEIETRLNELLDEYPNEPFEFEADFLQKDKDKFFYEILGSNDNISDYDVLQLDTFTTPDKQRWCYFYGIIKPFRSMYDENGAEYGYKYESFIER